MTGIFNQYDIETTKILDAFLPDKLFDSHMHISKFPFCGKEFFGFKEYYEDMSPILCERKVRCNGIVTPDPVEIQTLEGHLAATNHLKEELERYPENVGEIIVKPEETAEEIESHLIHKNIRGLKCYHTFASRPDTFNANINEYLTDSVFEVANKHKLAITLHMVKDRALADPENMKQIKDFAKRYPDATLILAHAARAFAAWTAIETVEELKDYENVWYDFAAVCESPAMMQIIKKVGVSRCMWGSDYNVSMEDGKAISIADSFYWISEKDIQSFSSKTTLHSWHVGTENLMAVRQACQLLDLSASDVEDIFYNNADHLFG